MRAPVTRVARLLVGTTAMGVGIALQIRARLGLVPWDVLHMATAHWLRLPFGGGLIVVSAVTLVMWALLGGRLTAVGMAGMVVVVVWPAYTVDFVLSALSSPELIPARALLLVGGVVLFAAGAALYLSADAGAGPRDALVLRITELETRRRPAAAAGDASVVRGLASLVLRGRARDRVSEAPVWEVVYRSVRVALEVGVGLLGMCLEGFVPAVTSGEVGVGTLLAALATGPLVAWFLRGAGRDAAAPQPDDGESALRRWRFPRPARRRNSQNQRRTS